MHHGQVGGQPAVQAAADVLELAEGVAAVQVLVLSVHLKRVVLRLLHQGLPEHRGLLPESTGHQCQGLILGGHLEGEAVLEGGGWISPLEGPESSGAWWAGVAGSPAHRM